MSTCLAVAPSRATHEVAAPSVSGEIVGDVTGDCPDTARALTRSAAVRDILTVAPGVMPFGVMLGVTIAGDGTGRLAGLFGAAFVFGGSAQLTAVTLLSLGATVLAALASAVVVNARILLYGAALEPAFRGQPLWFRLAAPLFIQDQTYLSALARPEVRGAPFRHYWGWLGGLLLAAWTSAVGIGLVAGPYLPDLPHLGLVSVALFVAMLVPRLVSAPAVASAVSGAAAAVAVAQLAPQLGIIAGAIAGVVTGLVVESAAERRVEVRA